MTGPAPAGSPPGPSRDRDDGGNTPDPPGLAGSRPHLELLASRVEASGGPREGSETTEPQRYWLYEHLRRLSREAERILEELESAQLKPKIILADFRSQCIDPLGTVHDDLLTYYWRSECLMETLAVTEVDKVLLGSVREVRKDWAALGSAIAEYSRDRQEPDSPQSADNRLVTGKAFHTSLLQFTGALSAVANSDGFKTQRLRLARLLGIHS
jgi:hypothetical protein